MQDLQNGGRFGGTMFGALLVLGAALIVLPRPDTAVGQIQATTVQPKAESQPRPAAKPAANKLGAPLKPKSKVAGKKLVRSASQTPARLPVAPLSVAPPATAAAMPAATGLATCRLRIRLQLAAETAVAPTAPTVPPPPATPEARYMAELDRLIAPVRDVNPTADDMLRLKAAARAPSAAAAADISDPAGRKLVQWLALRSGAGEPRDFVAFIAQNPTWADANQLLRRAEEQLFTAGGSSQKMRAFFKGAEPRTGAGHAALASAYLAEGDETNARLHAGKAWREFELPTLLEQGFLERFKGLLTEIDHKRRLDRILVDEVRFSGERTQRAAIARRIVPFLSDPEQKKADARLAIFVKAKLADQLLAAIPAEAAGDVDWGLAFQRIQQHRRNSQTAEATAIAKAAPTDPELIISPDDWWIERRGLAYDALKTGNPQLAYDLVRDAGPLSANPLKDQAHMAGWLALRYLKKTDVALAHFEVSRTAADGPLSRARANYWTARTFEELGRAEHARSRYKEATKDLDTFHGLLAYQKLAGSGQLDLDLPLPALPSEADVAHFNSLDSVRAIVLAAKSGLDRSIKVSLLGHLRNHLATEGEMTMLAHLAGALGDPQSSLRIGKTGIARGMNLIVYAYPLHAFPAYTPLRDPPETSMLLGIARQETEFNNQIISSAGARGLLQVMPITARHICRDHKVKCDLDRLITDNGYNATIASAYIGDRMTEFRGNYVLTLAGYNAGPGRARQWIRENGDPREVAVDPIDWIERISIEETREYVKKVLANMQIYRARLGEAGALRLEQDLRTTAQQARRATATGTHPFRAETTGDAAAVSKQ